MGNCVMGVGKEKEQTSVFSKQMDFRKEYLMKSRIWNLIPIKLYVTTYPLESLYTLWGTYLSFKTTAIDDHNPDFSRHF